MSVKILYCSLNLFESIKNDTGYDTACIRIENAAKKRTEQGLLSCILITVLRGVQ